MTRDNHSRRRDVRAYMARHHVSYTQALRALDAEPTVSLATPATDPLRVRSAETGGPMLPAIVTGENDVNLVCGHWLGHKCAGCGVCTRCDGCYCEEMRLEAQADAEDRRTQREHEKHWKEPDPDCPRCEDDRKRSADFTQCPACGKALEGFWHFREHNPPYCHKDNPHPPGLDWSHLIGKHITIDTHWLYQGKMAKYAASWTGIVTGHWKHPDTGAETSLYELQLDPDSQAAHHADYTTTPFDPREFTITEH